MQKSKLISLLGKLNGAEYSELILFARSPYFNKNKALTKLLEHLQKHHPLFSGTKMDKVYVYHKIYGKGAVYKEKRIDNLMSNSVKLTQQFLAFNRVKNNPDEQKKQELLAYRDKDMHSFFLKKGRQLIDEISDKLDKEDYNLHLFQLNKEVFLNPSTPRQNPGMPSLNNLFEHLDKLYLNEKLYFAVLAENRTQILNEKYEILLLDELKKTHANLIQESDFLKFLVRAYELMKTGKGHQVKILSEIFFRLPKTLDFQKRQNLFNVLLTITIRFNRENEKNLNKLIFSLYQYGLEEKILFDSEGCIKENLFLSIVFLSCNLREFSWSEKFIVDYAPLISQKENRILAQQLAEGFYYFSQAESNPAYYDKAMDYLARLDFPSLIYTYQVRTLILRLYYQKYLSGQEDIYLFSDYANSLIRQINRDKKTGNKKKEALLNFIKVLNLLLKAEESRSYSKIEQVRKKLKELDNLFAKDWIKRKIREITTYPSDC